MRLVYRAGRLLAAPMSLQRQEDTYQGICNTPMIRNAVNAVCGVRSSGCASGLPAVQAASAASTAYLRLDLREDRQLGDVVDHHECREQQQQHEGSLVDALLEPLIEIVPQHAFNQQQKDHAAVQNRHRQQVKDAQVQ